jgi:hypothetical protein
MDVQAQRYPILPGARRVYRGWPCIGPSKQEFVLKSQAFHQPKLRLGWPNGANTAAVTPPIDIQQRPTFVQDEAWGLPIMGIKQRAFVLMMVAVAVTALSFSAAQSLDNRPPQQIIPPVSGQNQNHQVLAGAGTAKCSKLNSQGKAGQPPQIMETPQAIFMLGWVQGFMSGSNMGTMAARNGYFDLGTIDIEEQWAFLTVYCQRNPDSTVYDATIELMRKRLNRVQ